MQRCWHIVAKQMPDLDNFNTQKTVTIRNPILAKMNFAILILASLYMLTNIFHEQAYLTFDGPPPGPWAQVAADCR